MTRSVKIISGALLALNLLACRGSEDPALQITGQKWAGLSIPQKQQALNALSSSCRLPSSTVRVLPDGGVAMQPEPTADYEDVDCLLGKLKPMRGFINLGFVGNEAYTEKKK